MTTLKRPAALSLRGLGILLISGLFSASAMAEPASGNQAQQPIPSAGNFLGLGVGAIPKTPGNSDLRVMLLPAVQYTWGDFAYVTGLKAGLWGFTSDDRSLRIGLYAEPRFGFDASDSPRTAGMADRGFAVDAGPSLRWTTSAGVLNLDYGFDITGRSNGQAAQIQFIRPLVTETSFRLNGLLGATWQNATMNTHYWGLRATETNDGQPVRIGAGTGFSASLTGIYRIDNSSAVFFGTTINRLSQEQADSPISDRRYTPVLYLGYGLRM